jgi:putrescine transport system substrate-binding protein
MAGMALAACGSSQETAASKAATGGAEEKALNIYNWSDYIAPDILPAFEKEYGIKVHYDVFDSNTVLQTKLLTGNTGYDLVVPSSSFMALQIKAGAFRKLDKSLLPNLKNVDPELARLMGPMDPGMQYGVNYFWGTGGVSYNVEKIKAAMPGAPVDSLAMFYDPKVISRFKDCGVTIIDEATEVVSTVLMYLRRDPNSEKPADLAAAEQVLMSIRPYVRYIDNFKYTEDLANGEICLALAWSGDAYIAAARARDAKRSLTLKYNIPKEGAVLFFDTMAIPADAPHPINAHLFINYMLRAEVAARNSSFVHYPTSDAAAYPLVDPAVYHDQSIYPSPETRQRLVPDIPHSQGFTRMLTRTWTRFKTGH